MCGRTSYLKIRTLLNLFFNLLSACYRLLEHPPKQVKDGLVSVCAQILACYRKNVASPSSVGQLILPETMKLLPLYLNCLLKNDALSGGEMEVDHNLVHPLKFSICPLLHFCFVFI